MVEFNEQGTCDILYCKYTFRYISLDPVSRLFPSVDLASTYLKVCDRFILGMSTLFRTSMFIELSNKGECYQLCRRTFNFLDF